MVAAEVAATAEPAPLATPAAEGSKKGPATTRVRPNGVRVRRSALPLPDADPHPVRVGLAVRALLAGTLLAVVGFGVGIYGVKQFMDVNNVRL